MTNSFQTSDGCAIGYTLRPAHNADAPRLALIHSLALDRSIWDGVARDSRARRICWPTIAADMENRANPAGPIQWSSSRMIWRSCSITSAGLQPPSQDARMGGCVAQAFGGLYPDARNGARVDRHHGVVWRGCSAAVARAGRESTSERSRRDGGFSDLAMVQRQVPRRAARIWCEAATRVFLANDLERYAATCILLGDADVRPFHAGVEDAGGRHRRRRRLRDAGRDGAPDARSDCRDRR